MRLFLLGTLHMDPMLEFDHAVAVADQVYTGKSAFGIMGYIHGIKWVYTISAWYMSFS
jgi:hypothetical protein